MPSSITAIDAPRLQGQRLSDIKGDFDVSALPVAYAFFVNDEESEAMALQKQDEMDMFTVGRTNRAIREQMKNKRRRTTSQQQQHQSRKQQKYEQQEEKSQIVNQQQQQQQLDLRMQKNPTEIDQQEEELQAPNEDQHHVRSLQNEEKQEEQVSTTLETETTLFSWPDSDEDDDVEMKNEMNDEANPSLSKVNAAIANETTLDMSLTTTTPSSDHYKRPYDDDSGFDFVASSQLSPETADTKATITKRLRRRTRTDKSMLEYIVKTSSKRIPTATMNIIIGSSNNKNNINNDE